MRINCCTQVEEFVIFGGVYYLLAINIKKRQMCQGRIKTPFTSTLYLQFCRDLNSKMYISFGGVNPDFSSKVSDFLDVTAAYQKPKIKMNHFKEPDKK